MKSDIDKENKPVCDFCRRQKLTAIYKVPTSNLGVSVCLCLNCGLAQSISKQKIIKNRTVSTSSDAGWGNIRQGKSLRFKKIRNEMDNEIDFTGLKRILDIGSNRGDFVKWIREKNTSSEITAVEPDKTLVGGYKNISNVLLITDRFEDIALPAVHFDFIYCLHTLEHAHSARQMLEKIYDCLSPSGFCLLEVPDLEYISSKFIVEEFFIDKHTFHFTRRILTGFLDFLGFEIFKTNDKDNFNITLILKKKAVNSSAQPSFKTSVKLINQTRKLIADYKKRFRSNIKKLPEIGHKLNELQRRQKIVIWGAGRIFDALVRYGKLKTDRIDYLIDTYLSVFPGQVHGIKVVEHGILRQFSPDAAVILATSSVEEIQKTLLSYGIWKIIKFQDLMEI